MYCSGSSYSQFAGEYIRINFALALSAALKKLSSYPITPAEKCSGCGAIGGKRVENAMGCYMNRLQRDRGRV